MKASLNKKIRFEKGYHSCFSLEEIEAKLSKELSYQIDVVKVSEETLKAEREKLENIEKEYAFIR